MRYKNVSGKPAINYETIPVSRFIEQYCPVEITAEMYDKITCKELGPTESTQKQFFDPRYQRHWGSWSHSKSCEYIKSVMQNQIYTPIVLAPRNSGEYETYYNQDGQHRSRVLAEFVTGKFGFTGTYVIDGKEYSHVNCLFKDLSDRERKIFLNHTNIIVGKITQNTVDLRKCFISINDGVPLNAQEKRNAIRCFMSEWSRKVGAKHEDIFKQISGVSSKIIRMADREYVSKLLLFFESYNEGKFTELNDKNITKMYNNRKGEDNEITNFIDKVLMPSLQTTTKTYRQKFNSKMRIYHLWVYSIILFNMWKQFKDNESEIDIMSIPHDDLWRYCRRVHETVEQKAIAELAPITKAYETNKLTADEYTVQKNKFYHHNYGRIHTAGSAKVVTSALEEFCDGNWQKFYDDFDAFQKTIKFPQKKAV